MLCGVQCPEEVLDACRTPAAATARAGASYDLIQRGPGEYLGSRQSGAPLLRLKALQGGRERPRRTAGLYHFAILLPTEEELGGLLRRTLEQRLPMTGTADHFVSQALYFDDPEGNGIEVYADRPRSEWQYPNGRLNIGTDLGKDDGRNLLTRSRPPVLGMRITAPRPPTRTRPGR